MYVYEEEKSEMITRIGKKCEGGRKERTEGDLKWTSLYTGLFVLVGLIPVVDQSVRLSPLWDKGLLI